MSEYIKQVKSNAGDRDNVVGIATTYGLYGMELEPHWG
jgi:hypothetical protein